MAEFQVVMKQWKRMCDFYFRCVDCPMHEPNGCINPTHSEWNVAAEHIEHTVMSWAAENPEPVYPTWKEWLADVGVLVCDTSFPNKRYWYTINKLKLEQPIPADIAEKLGLEPKEGA